MEWKDLSRSAKAVLERCWSLHNDKPRSFTAKIGDRVCNQLINEDTANEIARYCEHFPHIDFTISESHIYVNGNCNYGSWMKKNK